MFKSSDLWEKAIIDHVDQYGHVDLESVDYTIDKSKNHCFCIACPSCGVEYDLHAPKKSTGTHFRMDSIVQNFVTERGQEKIRHVFIKAGLDRRNKRLNSKPLTYWDRLIRNDF